MNKLSVYIRNTGRYTEVEGGTTLATLLRDSIPSLGFEPVCALVNNKTEPLSYPLYAPKEVEFLSPFSTAGHHVLVRSLCMMLYRAVTLLDPSLRLCIEHSVSRGYYCRLSKEDGAPFIPSAQWVRRLENKMHRLADAGIPFERHELRTPDVAEIFKTQHLADKVLLLSTLSDLYTPYYTFDSLADSFYGPLAPTSAHAAVFALHPWQEGMLMLGPDPENTSQPLVPLPQDKMFRAFTEHLEFNRIIGISSVGELNRAVRQKRTSDLINVAEALHGKLIGRIASEIRKRRDRGEASVVLMAGPSSSGKTTTSKRLAVQLMTELIRPKLISLDDYFVDRDKTPLDADGDYDYESLYALDLPRFNSDLRTLLDGGEINLPTYSFELGRRIERPRPLRLEANDVLIVEGIHGLNPELVPGIPAKDLFKVYVSALTTLRIDDHNWISTSDTRLLRRIVRDNKYRRTPPAETIRRWPSVRRGEEKWIFPFQENADATFNSSLLFEIAVVKPFAEPLLRSVPHNVPEYTQAYRLLRFLHCFTPVPPDEVPPTSLLREFLGGSSFSY